MLPNKKTITATTAAIEKHRKLTHNNIYYKKMSNTDYITWTHVNSTVLCTDRC